jgi:rhodanese-related sulfurtransferase
MSFFQSLFGAGSSIRSVDAAGLDAAIKSGAVVIDVRSAAEYASGHVAVARNIPLDQIEARLGELAEHKDADIYVICQSGRRSMAASEAMAKNGYKPINVDGGTSGWRAAGFPVA